MDEIAKKINGFEELDDTVMCYWWDQGYEAWMLYLPRCGLGNLKNHQVTLHDDGTITVSPSILVTGHDSGVKTTRHGFLERGVWREA